MSQLHAHVRSMNRAATEEVGFDCIIISTASQKAADFWKKRLESHRGALLPQQTSVMTVVEDWPGGAGNWLGTLYALKKAIAMDGDLLKQVQEGASVAIYHTAGKGKRLYPLTASEQGNKPAIRLPSRLTDHPSSAPLTLLEATIKQTAILAPHLKGRLGVFWSDQIFFPSAALEAPKGHYNLAAFEVNHPTPEIWKERGLHHYGIVIQEPNGMLHQLEKVQFPTVEPYLKKGCKVLVSLGSFSLSAELLTASLEAFAPELEKREGHMDSDPHVAMAMTLEEALYAKRAKDKGVANPDAHHGRIMDLCKALGTHAPWFSYTDLGGETIWLDYGNIDAYYTNGMRLLENSDVGGVLREFFHLPDPDAHGSIVLHSRIDGSRYRNSLIIDVTADMMEVENCILDGCRLDKLTLKNGLLYHVRETNPLSLPCRTVRADTFLSKKGEWASLTTTLGRDGKKDWSEPLEENSYSYAEVASFFG